MMARLALATETQNFNGSNPDGSFTTAVSNSFLSPLENSHSCRFIINLGDFLFYIENGILCVLIRIDNGNTQHTFTLKEIENISLFCLLTLRYH